MSFDVDLAWRSVPELLHGLVVALSILAPVYALGFVLSFGLAFLAVSRHTILRAPVIGYIEVIRGTPFLVQLFLIYFGLSQFAALRESPLWHFFEDAYNCAVLAFLINHMAYTAEIFRGAIRAIPRDLLDACDSLGLPRWLAFARVIFPLVLRNAWASYGNEIVLLLKGTSVVSTIAIMDILGVANRIFYETFDPLTPLLTAAAIYYVLYLALSAVLRAIEGRLSRHLRV